MSGARAPVPAGATVRNGADMRTAPFPRGRSSLVERAFNQVVVAVGRSGGARDESGPALMRALRRGAYGVSEQVAME
ncbi:hypothetical protein KVA01_07800 [Kocuria varians]|uniref:Uncharacterized protein n=1 Tax=Kocuria varians TaxID=1272 RepID=A0A4Y4D0B0_KOCVA|nr:hypothetical protein KVA01_07800 [Kocuria varians]